MAEGIARALGHDAASAGTHPASEVSKNALKVLESKGIEIFFEKMSKLRESETCGSSDPGLSACT